MSFSWPGILPLAAAALVRAVVLAALVRAVVRAALGVAPARGSVRRATFAPVAADVFDAEAPMVGESATDARGDGSDYNNNQ